MHGNGGQTDNKLKIFGNIFISFIGAGILGLPYAFKEAGIVEGIIVMTIVGALSVKSMLLLIDCKDSVIQDNKLALAQNGRKLVEVQPGKDVVTHVDYGEIGFVTFGSIGKFVVDMSIIITQLGFNCAYLIFISENIYSVLPVAPKMVYVACLLIPLLFLCNLRHLSTLAPFSILANFVNIFAYTIVFWFDLEHFHLVNVHIRTISIDGLPFFLGVAIYCYEGAGMVLSLEQSVLKDVRSIFKSLFKFALTIVTLLYIVFGVLGYLVIILLFIC
jgi:proton-coupled amino acid transporter